MRRLSYLSWTTGNSHNVLRVEPWESFGLLLVREKSIKVLELIVAAPAVHLSIISQG